MTAGTKQKLLAVLLLLALGAFAWWPASRGEFVSLDDAAYVTENSNVQAGLTWSGVTWAFSSCHSANWHPLTWLSHMLDVQLYGLQPLGHHLTSVLFHFANTLLLFLLLHRMTGALWRSALVAALFALHPLRVESVAWVAERKDVLSTFFGLLCLLAYARYAQESKVQSPRSKVFYVLALVTYALGLMSKPMLVTLPCVLLLLDYWPLKRIAECGVWSAESRFTFHVSRSTLLPLLLEKVPFFALSAASCLVTFLVQHSGGAVMSAAELPLAGRIANALVGYAQYLGKTVWPVNLACFYPRPEHWPAGQVALAVLLLAGITVVALRLLLKRPYIAVGWLWFLGMLVPVIGLVQVGEQAIADRYTYLPSIGLYVLVVWGCSDLAVSWPRLKPLLAAAAGFVVVALVLATRQQVPHWQNSEALFRHALSVTQSNPWVHCLLANTLADKGDFAVAEAQAREALRLKPGFPEIEILYARILADGGKTNEAVSALSDVLRRSPSDASAQLALAATLSRSGDVASAIEHYRQALALNPGDAQARFGLASQLTRQGDAAGAAEQYEQGLRSQPDSPDALNNLAWIRATSAEPKLRNGAEAVRLAERACALTGNRRPVMLGTLAAAYAEAGRFEEAIATAKKARDLAEATGQPDLGKQNQTLLEVYQARRPYHESAPSAPAP